MSLYQDVIGQLPILKTYNHGTLGFEVADGTHRGSIVEALQAAADKLTASFPWLGGAVINEGSGPGNSGLFMTVPWPASASSPNSIVRVKDCTDTLPSFADMVRAGAPCLMIDGKLVDAASGKTFPDYNPATGTVLAQVAEADAEDVDRAVKAARRAFDGGTPPAPASVRCDAARRPTGGRGVGGQVG